jgi:class 3 adenylate cyclase
VNIGARLLKHAAPGAIIASGEVFEELRRDAPRLAESIRSTPPSSCQAPTA